MTDQINIPINKIINPFIIQTDNSWIIAINNQSLIDTKKELLFTSLKAKKLNIIGLVNVSKVWILQNRKYVKLVPSDIINDE